MRPTVRWSTSPTGLPSGSSTFTRLSSPLPSTRMRNFWLASARAFEEPNSRAKKPGFSATRPPSTSGSM